MKNYLSTISITVFLVLVSISCRTVIISDQLKDKSDLALQQAISESDYDQIISFTALAKNDISSQQKELIEKIGITINTIAGTVITCMGTPSQIEELAKLDFIQRLEKSKSYQTK